MPEWRQSGKDPPSPKKIPKQSALCCFCWKNSVEQLANTKNLCGCSRGSRAPLERRWCLSQTQGCTWDLFRNVKTPEQNPRAHPLTQPAQKALHSCGITISRRKKPSCPQLHPWQQQNMGMSPPPAGHTESQPQPCHPQLPNCFSCPAPQFLQAMGGSQPHPC